MIKMTMNVLNTFISPLCDQEHTDRLRKHTTHFFRLEAILGLSYASYGLIARSEMVSESFKGVAELVEPYAEDVSNDMSQ